MLSNEFIRFLRDERGSYTIWSLLWFIMYVAIGGLAVDITDVFRNQNWLQATADSAALAGVMSLGAPGEDPVKAALTYSLGNMRPGTHGAVLNDEEVVIGTWSFSQERFYSGTSDPNAVYVTTRRGEQNGNPLAWSLLRILSMGGVDPWWNVKAEAVAVAGVHICHNNGIIAGRNLDIKTHTRFWEKICLIGHEGLLHRANKNYFQPGVYSAVGCKSGCVGPSDALAFKDETFNESFNHENGGNYQDPTLPLNALNVDKYVAALDSLDSFDSYESFETASAQPGIDYSGYEHLFNPDTGTVDHHPVDGTEVPEAARTSDENDSGRYTVYEFTCGNENLDLPDGNYYNLAIIADCRINLHSDNYKMSNVVLVSTVSGGWGIHANGKVSLGAEDCGDGGVEFYTPDSSVHFSAGGDVRNTRILSGVDINFAANADGSVGVHMEAVRDIFLASGSKDGTDFGLCPNDKKNGATVLSYSLVR